PGGLFAVVPCQWRRIIGSNSEVTSINSKKQFKRSLFNQTIVWTLILAWFLNKNEPRGPVFVVL
ncbi:hypothetical protein ABLV17_14095, partial [Klebsiella sp. CN_Kp091]|uniref:hypothetical protein n=1 Tax=unclassified Klebsiella TaxID=2608929 RepID=UPI0032B5F255